jgi:hypothetical protein
MVRIVEQKQPLGYPALVWIQHRNFTKILSFWADLSRGDPR